MPERPPKVSLPIVLLAIGTIAWFCQTMYADLRQFDRDCSIQLQEHDREITEAKANYKNIIEGIQELKREIRRRR